LIPEFDWYLMVEQSTHPLEGALFSTLVKNMAIGVLVSVFFLLFIWLTIGGYQRRLEQMATTDKLTGIMNRQSFEYNFRRLRTSSSHDGSPLSLVIIDIDHFKQINDHYGHLVGDRVLQRVAQLIMDSLRRSDRVFRWGGDEFLVLLKECAGEEALLRMQTLVQLIGQTVIDTPNSTIHVTASCGVAAYRATETLDQLMERADIALYQAKQQGRNRANRHDD